MKNTGDAVVRSENLLSLWLAAILWAAWRAAARRRCCCREAPPRLASRSLSENPDQARLKEALTGRELSPAEVADLSDRLLATGSVVSEQDMARLELVLLKA